VPVIYANDNFGHWQSDLSALLEQTRQAHPLSEKIVKELAPLPSDFVVLKPAHSAFFQAPLEKLLEHLEVGRLVIGGVSGDQCVLATSSDALMRGFEVVVPRTVIASPTAARNKRVLAHFRTAMDIPTPDARSIRWSRS
jgi:nicotinamidase-related amidase